MLALTTRTAPVEMSHQTQQRKGALISKYADRLLSENGNLAQLYSIFSLFWCFSTSFTNHLSESELFKRDPFFFKIKKNQV